MHQLCTQDAPSLYAEFTWKRRGSGRGPEDPASNRLDPYGGLGLRLSALGRDNANHAREPGFRSHGKSPLAKRCRYPLRIQPELSVRADSQLPCVAASFMKHVMDIDMIGSVFQKTG